MTFKLSVQYSIREERIHEEGVYPSPDNLLTLVSDAPSSANCM